MKFLHILFLILQINHSALSNPNFAQITNDFFKLKRLNHGIILSCGDQRDLMNSMKSASQSGIIAIIENLNSPFFADTLLLKDAFENYFKNTDRSQFGVSINLDCPNVKNVIKMASTMELFDITHQWLLVANDNFLEKRAILDSIEFQYDGNVLLAVKEENSNKSWIIFDIYNPGVKFGGQLNIIFHGFWSPISKNLNAIQTNKPISSNNTVINEISLDNIKEYRNSVLKRDDLYIRKSNWRIYRYKNKTRKLQGITLTGVITLTNKPPKGGVLRYIKSQQYPDKDTMHRFNYALFCLMMEMFDFKIKIVRTDNWGIIKNGTWTGVIGALVYGLAEISITPTQFKVERIGIIDLTTISWLARPCILFKHPRNVGLRDNFIRPLSFQVWWCMLIILILAAIIFKLANRQENISAPSCNTKTDGSWSSIIMLTIVGVISQQGLSNSPNMQSSRLIAFMILVFSFLIFQFYSASIVSSLLMEPPRTINTLDDLTDSKMQILIEDIPYNYDFFDSTNDPAAVRLYKKRLIPQGINNVYVTPKVGLDKVKKGGYGFQIDIAAAYRMIPKYFDERSICDLTEIQLFPPKPTIPIVKRGSPYRQMISVGLCKIQESGIMKYHRAVWHAPKPECTLTGKTESVSVTITETASAFVILATSFIIAIIILIIEIYWGKKFKTQ